MNQSQFSGSSFIIIKELEERLKTKVRENEELKRIVINSRNVETKTNEEEKKALAEITDLKAEKDILKSQLEESRVKIADHEEKIFILLEENTKLNKACQENLYIIENLKKEKNELETTYKSLAQANEQILKETNKFESKIEEIANNYEKLTDNFILVSAENERIHQLLEEFNPELDSSTLLYVGKLENEKLILENEIEKWKLEYDNLKYMMKTNEELIRKNQELNNTVKNFYFSQSIGEDKYQKIVSELVEKIKFLSLENERLNHIILNRCKEMMNTW